MDWLSLKQGNGYIRVCMKVHYIILATCKYLKLSIIKRFLKTGMYKKYCGLYAQKRPPGGLRVCVACRHILFGLWDCFKKNVFSFLIQHLKIRRFHIKIRISNFSWKVESSGNAGPQQQAPEHGLPPPFVSLALIHGCGPPVCGHLSLAPSGQGSSEQWESANTRARVSRINMFHYQPKPLQLCFLNSNQEFLKTSTWTVLVYITQAVIGNTWRVKTL